MSTALPTVDRLPPPPRRVRSSPPMYVVRALAGLISAVFLVTLVNQLARIRTEFQRESAAGTIVSHREEKGARGTARRTLQFRFSIEDRIFDGSDTVSSAAF